MKRIASIGLLLAICFSCFESRAVAQASFSRLRISSRISVHWGFPTTLTGRHPGTSYRDGVIPFNFDMVYFIAMRDTMFLAGPSSEGIFFIVDTNALLLRNVQMSKSEVLMAEGLI